MMELTPAMEKFILHWGEMGTRWGINRTIAQIHALLYIAQAPLTAEDITDTLGVARSNVSTSLRELQGWGVIRVVHVMGDRRDHFESMKEVWEMFRLILDERIKREIVPTITLLEDCIQTARTSDKPEDKTTHERLVEMHKFFTGISSWYTQIRAMEISAVKRFVMMGVSVKQLLSKLGMGRSKEAAGAGKDE